MRLLIPLLLPLLAAAETLPPPADVIVPKSTIKLFNGKNLDGWYTWLEKQHYEDPDHVFSVQDGMVKITGTEWGGLTTRAQYRDFHLVMEWKWGGPAHGKRAKAARDNGIMLHARGRDGAHGGVWLESIECQIIEGGTGDLLLVGGDGKPSLTVETRVGPDKQLYWHPGGERVTRNTGRFNWYGRDVQWKDVIDFRGSKDVEKPVGEWNRYEIFAKGGDIIVKLNDVIVNAGTDASHTWGKIQIESEGAEMLIRKLELHPIKTMPSLAGIRR